MSGRGRYWTRLVAAGFLLGCATFAGVAQTVLVLVLLATTAHPVWLVPSAIGCCVQLTATMARMHTGLSRWAAGME